jgi:hypothetical protein
MTGFPLKEFRLSLRWHIGPIVLLICWGWPLLTLWIWYVVAQAIGFETKGLLLSVAAAVGVALGWLIWNDFRLRPAGELKIGSGRLRFTAWTGAPIDISLLKVRKKFVFEFSNGRPNILAIYLAGWPRKILIHGDRLSVSVWEVNDLLSQEIASIGLRRPVSDASEMSVRWRNAVLNLNRSRLLRGIHWLHYAVGALALLMLILTRGTKDTRFARFSGKRTPHRAYVQRRERDHLFPL